MNEIRLPRGADVGAKEDPCVGSALEVWMALQVRIDPEMSELMAAQRDEEAVAERLAGSDGANRFQPTNEPAARLARALPPAAARGHDDDGRERWIEACDSRRHVERLRGGAIDLCHKRYAGARGGLLAQPRGF